MGGLPSSGVSDGLAALSIYLKNPEAERHHLYLDHFTPQLGICPHQCVLPLLGCKLRSGAKCKKWEAFARTGENKVKAMPMAWPWPTVLCSVGHGWTGEVKCSNL